MTLSLRLSNSFYRFSFSLFKPSMCCFKPRNNNYVLQSAGYTSVKPAVLEALRSIQPQALASSAEIKALASEGTSSKHIDIQLSAIQPDLQPQLVDISKNVRFLVPHSPNTSSPCASASVQQNPNVTATRPSVDVLKTPSPAPVASSNPTEVRRIEPTQSTSTNVRAQVPPVHLASTASKDVAFNSNNAALPQGDVMVLPRRADGRQGPHRGVKYFLRRLLGRKIQIKPLCTFGAEQQVR